MAQVQAQQPPVEERQDPPVPERISTNNPFRRGTGSPAPSPAATPRSPMRLPVSRNPFLDHAPEMTVPKAERTPGSPSRPTRNRPVRSPSDTQGLLANMSLDDGRPSEDLERPMNNGHGPPRRPDGRPPAPPGAARRPPPRGPPRPRRNSDTSVNERRSVDEEGNRRTGGSAVPGAHKSRPKDSQGRPIPSKEHRSRRPNRKVDVIDRLDLTGIYGEGTFHHDGPFDACNPHRNRKGATPMSAFAKDSLNNAIGGSGPVRKNIDLDRIHGHQADSFNDFSAPATRDPQPQYEPFVQAAPQPRRVPLQDGVDRTNGFDPTSKVDRVHGNESLGLGTSTFLEGAPAARAAIQRRESEGDGPGLARKKSLAQRIRGMSNNRPRGNSNGAMVSPDARYERNSPEVLSAGGLTRIHEQNPFFQDHDAAYAKKGASIQAEETNANGAPVQDADQEAFTAVSRSNGSGSAARSSSVAAPGSSHGLPHELQRSVTEDGPVQTFSANVEERNRDGNGGGFLSRVKSLRGGRREKPQLNK